MTPDPDYQRIGRIAFVTVSVALTVFMLWRFLPALAWAAVLAIATWPLRQRLVALGVRPWLIAMLLTALLALALMVPLALIGIQIAREVIVVAQSLRGWRESGLATPDWIAQLPLVGSYVASWWQQNLADPQGARELLGRAQSLGVLHWTQLGSELAGRIAILLFALLALFFLYRDGPQIVAESERVADRAFGSAVRRIGADAVNAVRATVNGLVLVGFAEGVILGVAYWAAGLPHTLLFTFATAVLASVPFGAPLIFGIAALTLAAQAHLVAAILIVALGVAVTFIADHFVRPVLIGSSARIPFLWVLLGIFGGLETFGLVGLFLGPALISVVLAIWRDAGANRV
ncbi:MAG TPA: AI-2E family transporter [Xanthobacteraceae bacterium]|nr:AI-2E family transporter [Xanthobacteraceae bacterium]